MENSNEELKGYVIVPLSALPDKDIKAVQSHYSDAIITPKELLAMYASSVLEINKGDQSKKSLNVKLYNCIAYFAHTELDEITNRTFKRMV